MIKGIVQILGKYTTCYLREESYEKVNNTHVCLLNNRWLGVMHQWLKFKWPVTFDLLFYYSLLLLTDFENSGQLQSIADICSLFPIAWSMVRPYGGRRQFRQLAFLQCNVFNIRWHHKNSVNLLYWNIVNLGVLLFPTPTSKVNGTYNKNIVYR